MRNRYSRGSTVRLFFDIVSSGAGVISQTPSVAIQRRVNDEWFQSSDGSWQPTLVTNAMTETDSVKLPGRYHFDFDQSLDLESGSSEYIAKKSNAAGTLALEYEDLVFGPLAGASGLSLCSVQGTISTAQGSPVPNAVVVATLVPVFKDALGRAVESDHVIATYTNTLGDFDLQLVRGGVFRLEISAVGYDRKVTIPDQDSVLFTDL